MWNELTTIQKFNSNYSSIKYFLTNTVLWLRDADLLIGWPVECLGMKTIIRPSELSQIQSIFATANIMAMFWLIFRFMTPFGWAISVDTFGGYLIVGTVLFIGIFGAFFFLFTLQPIQEKKADIIVADNWNESERRIISYLLLNSGECFQSELLEGCMFSNSVKISRTITKLIDKDAILKFRDGMGNRLVLKNNISLSNSRRFEFGKHA